MVQDAVVENRHVKGARMWKLPGEVYPIVKEVEEPIVSAIDEEELDESNPFWRDQ